MNKTNPFDFDKLVENEIKRSFIDFDNTFKHGIHIGKLYDKFSMLGSLIGESIFTPKFKDGWLFGGFSLKAEMYEREREKKKHQK